MSAMVTELLSDKIPIYLFCQVESRFLHLSY